MNRLGQLGGKKPNEAIRLRMKYLITDQVLDHFTWRGTGEKNAFEKLTFLNDLIFKSVRQNFKNLSFKDYQSYMVQWLKHSTTRQRTVVYQYPNRYTQNDDLDDDFPLENHDFVLEDDEEI